MPPASPARPVVTAHTSPDRSPIAPSAGPGLQSGAAGPPSRGRRLRIAVVTESFLPTRNGVTTSVCRVLEHLAERGHDAIVICPGPAPESFAGAPVISVPSFVVRHFPVGLPSSRVMRTLASFAPDVVHLASPFVLGANGVTAAAQLGVPSVAVFQTDVADVAGRNRAGLLRGPAWRWIRRIHEQADLTLAPSGAALGQLRDHDVPRLKLWQRGVDAQRFTPQRREQGAGAALRARLAPEGELLVGYIGRLAPEKRVERLAALAGLTCGLTGPRAGGTGLRAGGRKVRLVIGGDGPARRSIERALRDVDPVYLGWLDGDELADAYAALDVFVHTGTEETFGQTLQEALASGVPVVAPASGGPLDLIAPGLNGLLYGPDDDAALCGAVASLAENAEQRVWMGIAARAGVERRTWQLLGDELISHYRSLMSSEPAPAS